MARYDWPKEFVKSPDRLASRAERNLRRANLGMSADLMDELDELAEMIAENLAEDRLWMPLGPSIMTNGQATGNPQVAGRIREVCVNSAGTRAYAASANGGVWYSADSGASWSPVGSWGLRASVFTGSRQGLSLTCGALDVHFGQTGGADDPDKDVVYVGTGEAVPWASSTPGAKHGGIGVLRMEGTISDVLENPGVNPWKREANNLSGAGIFRLTHDPASNLAFDPANNNVLVAASSTGLWFRNGRFDENDNWQRVSAAPFTFDANDGPYCTDVVWNDRGLWVALVEIGANSAIYRSTNGVSGPFTKINLPNLQQSLWNCPQRLSLCAAPHDTRKMYVLGKRTGLNIGHAHMWLIDLSHDTNAHNIANFPIGLFSSSVTVDGAGNNVIASDQSDYDVAFCVTQSGGNDIIFAGGSTQSSGGPWEASIFRLTIAGTAAAGNLSTDFANANQANPAADPTFAGRGIHADIHCLKMNGTNLWVGCDGGVFLRDNAGNARPLNAGLAVCEPGYVQSHPNLEGVLMTGTQDNGFIQRIGDTVWRLRAKGDGGGCAYHPTKPHQIVQQYTGASWTSFPGMNPRSPALRQPFATRWNSENTEDSVSEFYSKPASAITNNANQARIFIGTDRIWYSADWDQVGTAMNWVTIPSLSDPYGPTDATNNIWQDGLTENGNPDPVLSIEILAPGDETNGFDGCKLLVLCARTVRIFRFAQATGNWTSLANSVISTASGVDRPKIKKNGADVPNPFVDFMPRKSGSAWTDIAPHDGANESFYLTTTGKVTVRNNGTLDEDEHYDVCWWYNGSGRWYPTGLRNTPIDRATGRAGSRASAHSVVVDPTDPDTVYVGNKIGVWRGEIDTSGDHPSWSWTPILDGLPQALVEDLSIFSDGSNQYLRAALVARGVWERDISVLPVSVGRTYIRAVGFDTGRVTLPPSPPREPINNTVIDYHSSPDIIITPQVAQAWGAGNLPNEADMLATTQPASRARGTYDAWVMVHHRHTVPVDTGDVDIHLFLQTGAPAGSISGIAVNDAWRDAVLDTVRGSPPAAFPAGLSHLGLFHNTRPVDARTPRATKIPVDLNFALVGGGGFDHVAIIAVVGSEGSRIPNTDLAQANLEDIVRRSSHVAVRKIRRT